MIRAIAAAICLLVVGATPAVAAMSPPPTRLTFDSQPAGTPLSGLFAGSGLHFSVAPTDGSSVTCTGSVINEAASGHRALQISCPAPQEPQLQVTFPDAQAWVGMQLSPDSVPAFFRDYTLNDSYLDDTIQSSSGSIPPGRTPWSPPVSLHTDGAAIGGVRLEPQYTTSHTMTIRSLAYSPWPQPTTGYTARPAAVGNSGTASFAFESSLPGAVWSCSLDDGPAQDCSSQLQLSVAEGTHSLRVSLKSDDYEDSGYAIDEFGTFWVVDLTRPETSVAVNEAGPPFPAQAVRIYPYSDDSRARFECSLDGGAWTACAANDVYTGLAAGPHRVLARAIDTAGNVDATPAQADWTVVPDRLLAPAGALIAGKTANLDLLSGEVLVFLAGHGFVPLIDSASVPVGASIDARKGSVQINAAASFSSSPKSQSAEVAAGIFAIRQRRAKAAAAITDLTLQTPSGSAAACATGHAAPAKGIVRALTGSAKGRFRALGAAARVTIRNASWTIEDTCHGTRVRISRGTASVYDTTRKRTITVRAGKTYLAKARLFGAKQHS